MRNNNNNNNNSLGDRATPQYCDQSEAEYHSKISLNNLDIAGQVQDIGEAITSALRYERLNRARRQNTKNGTDERSMSLFHVEFFFELVRIISGGGRGGNI